MSELDERIRAGGGDLLTSLSPVMLIGCFLLIAVISWISARAYRNTNDFRKSVRLYFCLAAGISIVYYLTGIPVILIAGYLICGFIFTALISNHYFYS